MSDVTETIAENLAAVRERIDEAARSGGRTGEEITLVAVTKYAGSREARALVEAGCRDLGESRPQALWKKAEAISDLDIAWHLIGHLQRNKAARTLPLVSLAHSIDSRRLLDHVNRCAAELGRPVRVLLQVNISGESAKGGFTPDELFSLVPELDAYNHVQVCGLMGMAGLGTGIDGARRDFARLRELREHLQAGGGPCSRWVELSMGMSGDYETAIAEGATIVRVGSALFEGIDLDRA